MAHVKLFFGWIVYSSNTEKWKYALTSFLHDKHHWSQSDIGQWSNGPMVNGQYPKT